MPRRAASSLLALLFAFSPLGAREAQAGLLNAWTFDSGPEEANGGPAATLRANTSYGPGVVGTALSIDANGGGASVPNVLATVGTGDFSISLWVNYDGDFSGHARHESTLTGWSSSGKILNLMGEKGGGQTFYTTNKLETYTFATASWIAAQDTWHHVVLGRSGGQQFLCQDGVLHAGTSAGGPVNYSTISDNALWLGFNPYESGGRSWPGLLDEVQVYDEWIGADGCAALYADPGLQYGVCVDDDGDGVCADVDACPAEDSLLYGPGYDTDGDGCLDDTDGDGLAVPYDICPDDVGGVAGDGCPDTEAVAITVRGTLELACEDGSTRTQAVDASGYIAENVRSTGPAGGRFHLEDGVSGGVRLSWRSTVPTSRYTPPKTRFLSLRPSPGPSSPTHAWRRPPTSPSR